MALRTAGGGGRGSGGGENEGAPAGPRHVPRLPVGDEDAAVLHAIRIDRKQRPDTEDLTINSNEKFRTHKSLINPKTIKQNVIILFMNIQ